MAFIDENVYAFGIDGSRYASSNGLMDFKVAALSVPTIRFVAFREGISWAYKDPFFDYHWSEAKTMHQLRRTEVSVEPMPVGRFAYHVLYPGEDITRQVDNCFKNIGDQADWYHDRLVIDAELDHGQSRTRITYAINTFGELCKAETGMLPVLYSRYYWLLEFTYPCDLLQFDHWLAQYRSQYAYPAFTPEREPPPNPTFGHWLIHQTGDKADADRFGVYGKHYFDTDRWNGDAATVAEYFDLKDTTEPGFTLEEQVAKNAADIHDLQGRVKSLEEGD